MKKRTINIIIILMSVAFLGISVIQFYWLKRGVDLNAQNFDDRVRLALSRVKQHLEQDADMLKSLTSKLEAQPGSTFAEAGGTLERYLNKPALTYRDRIRKKQLQEIAWFTEPNEAIESIEPASLSRYLRLEFAEQDISLDYDYGVFSNDLEDFIITNGKYNAIIGPTDQMSKGAGIKALERTTYQINLFNLDEENTAGSLRVFFPKKTSFLISSVLPALLSSILLTGLILFCFIYTINVILTQKKVSLMKTDFINNMTHEFKTPIATISLAADSINNPRVKTKPELIDRYANIIREENSRMLSQVEKVLQIARLDKKDFELKVSEVDINDLVSTAMDLTALKVKQRGGAVTAKLTARNSVVEGDENHISNLLHNLLDNANKYSPNSPQIHIETGDAKGGVEIRIYDEGIGMTKEDTRRIFEKFYRVSTGNLHDVKGFGLGLSYVKAIIDAHKGHVDVQSVPGQGSTFTIFFPHKLRTK
ncbi:MAG: HAMP domain-containing sensor histidine kinase [Bacteroidota bacterium]